MQCKKVCNRLHNKDNLPFSDCSIEWQECYRLEDSRKGRYIMNDFVGYLFVYFTGESELGEQVYFSVSKDGLYWEDLNGGKPVLLSGVGERGVRDPFILRSAEGDRYYIIATDLRIAGGKGWSWAVTQASRSVVIWESDNLTDWSKEKLVEVGIPEAGCVWAPEAVYDEKNGEYMMFWASNVKEEQDAQPKQRIYCARTKDFHHFTKTEKYIERENHVIDTTIIEEDGWFYRISKDETTKNIRIDKGQDLLHGPFVPVPAPALEQIMGVEGPCAFRLNDSGQWCLMIDQFLTDGGYLPLITDSLSSGEFKVLDRDSYHMGITKKRHGSVLRLNQKEYDTLLKKYKF